MNQSRENSILRKCAYALADIYGGGAFVVISTFFTVFLTKSLGMGAALAGTIPLIGRAWDAITDPIMGNIVDRTKSKYGAKRFYILIGSFISTITFLLLWTSFIHENVILQYVYYVFMYMLFSTGFTIVMVPYNGLLPDMVSDYRLRSEYSSVRTIFSTVGAIIAGLIPTIIITDNTDSALYQRTSVIFAVIFVVAILLTFFGTWERKRDVKRLTLKESFTQSFSVYKSHSFRLFLGIFLCGQGAADFVTGLAVYYVDDVLDAYGGGRFTILMGVILISQFIGTLIFSFVMPRTSKKMPILIGFPIRIIATIALLFCSKEGAAEIIVGGNISLFTVILILSFVIGIGMAASSVSIYAILSDMADVDELITSINRPGTVSGMATFVRKIATGFSASIIGILLTIVGYDEKAASEGARQILSVQHGIANIYVWVPIVLMVLTIIFAFLFPLNDKEFAVIQKELQSRRNNESTNATAEEKRICEKVTGFKYKDLWKESNALKMR